LTFDNSQQSTLFLIINLPVYVGKDKNVTFSAKLVYYCDGQSQITHCAAIRP